MNIDSNYFVTTARFLPSRTYFMDTRIPSYGSYHSPRGRRHEFSQARASSSQDAGRYYELRETRPSVAQQPAAHSHASALPPPVRAHRRGASSEIPPSAYAPEARLSTRGYGVVEATRAGHTNLYETDLEQARTLAKRSLRQFETRIPLDTKERNHYYSWFVDWHLNNPGQQYPDVDPPRYERELPQRPELSTADYFLSVGSGVGGILVGALSSQVESAATRAGMIGAGVTAVALGAAHGANSAHKSYKSRKEWEKYSSREGEV